MNSKTRTKTLQDYGVLDTEMQQELSGLIELASTVCETPISLINLLDTTSQITKANKGWDIQHIPKEKSFCQYTVRNRDVMIVEDALQDERFQNSEFVQGDPNIRFYAGAPLTTSEGINIGAICTIDTQPKKLSDSQKDSLRLIANEVMARFTLHKKEQELKAQNQDLEDAGVFLQNSSDVQAIIGPESKRITDINDEATALIGVGKEDLLGRKFGSFIADAEKKKELLGFLNQQAEPEGTFNATVSTDNNAKRHLEYNFTLHKNKWYMTARDITERKEAQDKLRRERKLSDRIINNLPNMFFMYDAENNLIRWNNRFVQSTGYNEQEIVYMDPVDFFPEDQKQVMKEKVTQVFEEGQASIEATLLTKQGKKIPYLFEASRFIDQGEPYLLGTGQDITDQKEYQSKIQTSLKEKETLLSEIHHRVKNNLAVISGLLQLEGFQSENKQTQRVLRNSQLRIQSMATVHEMFYQSSSFNNLRFDDFVENMVEAIQATITNQTNPITFEFDVEPLQLNINQAVPCGLILNELITNAYKHAYPDSGGVVEVSIETEGKKVTMGVEDNGIGLPERISIDEPMTLGFTLINNLSKQINAKLLIDRQQGTKVSVQFTKEDKKGAGSSMSME